MKKPDVTWKVFGMYMLILLFVLLCGSANGQIQVAQYNADWNKENTVKWCTSKQLENCIVSYVDIGENPEAQKEHSVVVVPTIVIFNGGEEVKRYQADLSFKIIATKEDLQEYIDELLAEDY